MPVPSSTPITPDLCGAVNDARSPGRRRQLQRLSGALLSAALPPACAHDGPLSEQAALAPASGDTLTVVGPWELTGLEPSRGGYMFTRMEVVQTLLDADDQGRLLPALASEWEVSNDGLEWRFFIAQGRLFHDGSPLTAGTVLASLKRALAAPGVLRLARIRSMTVSRGAILVTLAQPYAPLPYLFTHSGTQILAPSSYGADGRVLRIVGSGPYAITAISLPQQFDVAFFEQWRGEPPAVRRARYISVSRAETRTLMVQSGQADLAFTLDPPSIRRLQGRRDMQLVAAPLPRTTFLKLNAAPSLAERRARAPRHQPGAGPPRHCARAAARRRPGREPAVSTGDGPVAPAGAGALARRSGGGARAAAPGRLFARRRWHRAGATAGASKSS